jgi:diacylglycerol kinase (ATP)
MEAQRFSFTKRVFSLYHALSGICRFFRSEHNAWLHLAATFGVIIMCMLFPVSSLEALLLVLSIGFVWAAEIFNTCVEKMMDFISTETHPQIKLIKDMAAGAVLVAALTALIIGLLTFIPKIF